MARGKKGRKLATNVQIPEETLATKTVGETAMRKSRYTILDYIIVCVFFIGFCYLQKYVALHMMDNDTIEKWSLDFFFDTLWKGFVIVAILVGLHDFLYRDVEEDTA
ncbi:MAG: hypothetical protein AB1656_12255 [Candidatus Omnitrophota bacterium]